MRRRNAVLLATVLGTAGLIGCDKAAPTEPARLLEDFPAAKASAQPGLSGPWSGTITFYAFNDPEGDSSFSPCDETGTAQIQVQLTQDGQALTGLFQTGCAGALAIDGTVVEAQLSGTLRSSHGQGFGRIFGTVSSSHIQFRTVQTTDDEDDNGKDNDGDASYKSSDVDLHRSQLVGRTPPLVVDSGRATRALPSRR